MIAHTSSAVATPINGMLNIYAAFLGINGQIGRSRIVCQLEWRTKITEVAVLNPPNRGNDSVMGSIVDAVSLAAEDPATRCGRRESLFLR